MDSSKETIWILDDEEDVSEIVAWDLSQSFNTKTFNHPDLLIDELRAVNKHPDLVISDIAMPGMNGIELSKVLFQEFEIDFPIILISGYAEKSHAFQAMELGVARIVEKPFSKEQLGNAVDEVLKIARLERLNDNLILAYRKSMDTLEALVDQYKIQCNNAEQRLFECATTDDTRAAFTDYLAALPDHDKLEQLCKSAHDNIETIEKAMMRPASSPAKNKKAA